MPERKIIGIGNLLLDVNNYRHVKASSQKEARDLIIADQGKKLVEMAKHIIKHGLSSSDLPIGIKEKGKKDQYILVEGNRRLTAIQLLHNPEQAQGTSIYSAFKKLSKDNPIRIPNTMECDIASDRKTAFIWIDLKHSKGTGGAGVETWSAMAKARRDADEGHPQPALDAINFVLGSKELDPEFATVLEGSEFNITTLENRIIGSKAIQQELGLEVQNGKLVCHENKDWVREVLTEVLLAIAKSEFNNKKFTVDDVRKPEDQKKFISSVIEKHPKGRRRAPKSAWQVTSKPISIPAAAKPKPKLKTTPNTGDRVTLIPRLYKLHIEDGKINNIYHELKKLKVEDYRYAVSVLFRVFLELTVDRYMESNHLPVNFDKDGRVTTPLGKRLQDVCDYLLKEKILTKKETGPITKAAGNLNSMLSPDTLNAYVHSRWMNPLPIDLKTAWDNVSLFIAALWEGIE